MFNNNNNNNHNNNLIKYIFKITNKIELIWSAFVSGCWLVNEVLAEWIDHVVLLSV